LQGKLLVGSLKFSYVSVCDTGDEVTCHRTVFDGIGRVRNIRQGPDGYLYVATDGTGIFRIVVN